MPRRGTNSDSQKENIGLKPKTLRTNVKADKGTTAATPNTKMNNVESPVDSDDEEVSFDNVDEGTSEMVNQRDGTLATGSDDEDDATARSGYDDNSDSDEDEEGSPNGRKRIRINEKGESKPILKEEKPKIVRCVTLPRDKDGYVPGSIVRVQLKNFVTYDFVEFCPGPNLNMIFGPNGTGKSSIACALCIGLNGTPSLLGRSNDLNAFVKHGQDTGYVELELKGKIGTPNLVIRRNINSKTKGSQFTLNGNTVIGREINERIAELNIQVGNLCSFLPQDRVSEFAQMTPQQLLKETQRTAGNENLTQWHTTLIEKGQELKKANITLEDELKRVHQLEEKQKGLERDVRRFRERQAIERQIELLELVLPYVEYRESKVIYDEAKLERERALAEYRQLEETNRPMKVLQSELNQRYKELEEERSVLKKQIRNNYTKAITSITKRNQQAAARAEEALEKIKALKRQEKETVRNKATTKENIAKLQVLVDNPPEHEAPEPVADGIKTIQASIGELKREKVGVESGLRELVRETSQYDNIIQEKQSALRELENHMTRKISALQNWDKDCADVVRWLMNHKETNEFAKRVELPAIVGATVRDKRFTNAVEACFNANQLKTFVAHSEEDYNTFNRLFIDTGEALGHKARVTVWYRPYNEAQLPRPPLSQQELRELGFDGYADDFVECAEGLRWFLVKELNMHRTPVALNPRNIDDARVQAALSRFGPDGRPPANSGYISGMTFANVSRSSYGQQKTMTVTRNFKQARSLIHSTVDQSAKEAIEAEIKELELQNEEVKAKIRSLQAEERRILDKIESYKASYEALKDRQQVIKNVMSARLSNETKLASLKDKLKAYEDMPSAEAERQKLKTIVDKTVKERSKILTEFVDLTQMTIKDQSALAVISLKQIQLAANVQAIDELCNAGTAEARRVKQAYDEATERFETAKTHSKKKVAATKDKLATADDELQQTFKDLEAQDHQKPLEERWTSDKVQAALDTEQAKLELNHATDAGVIETYEARKREIENLQANVETKRRKYKKLEEKIQKTRDLWYPALDKLVKAVSEKFSTAFDRINCAGEVKIKEEEDYDKWSIQIWVKFRDNEPLTLLTGQRQSGGERSLTTIMYLMSLTEHARAPFSLVDEINQGMDQRYERAVHDQLVQVTCQTESSQYFLITPKLLPGLRYHESMKILCVNNGEWLPESTTTGVGNMQKMIDNFLEKRRPGPLAS